MSQSTIFGILELGPVILTLSSLWFLFKSWSTNSRAESVYSAICVSLAGLIHERFMNVAPILALSAYLHSKKEPRFRGLWLGFLGGPLFYFYSTQIVLKIDSLRGGGEERLRSTAGTWILGRLLRSVEFMLGGNGLVPAFTNAGSVGNSYFTWSGGSPLNAARFVVVLLVVAIVATMTFKRMWRQYSRRRPVSISPSMTLFLVSFGSLIPSATVSSRIEPRWLYFSFVIAVVLIQHQLWLSRKFVKGNILSLLVLLAVLIAGLQFWDKQNYKYFLDQRIRSQVLFQQVEDVAPISGGWYFRVDSCSRDTCVPIGAYDGDIYWMTGYLRMFHKYLSNPPLNDDQSIGVPGCPTVLISVRNLRNDASSKVERQTCIELLKE